MIAGIRGKIHSFGPSRVYMDASGVIYEVYIPLNVFETLQQKHRESSSSNSEDETVYLYVHHQFLPDGQRLYGFLRSTERDMFGALQQIKGMGSALALSVLSHLDGPGILDLCERGDVESLKKIPRIGKSTAETIVFEVSRKKERWKKLLFSNDASHSPSEELTGVEDPDLVREALLQLGYREVQVDKAIALVRKEAKELLGPSDWIKRALVYL